MDTEDAACRAAASSALSALADADSDILQKLGVERLVSMAVRAETPPMRAATITFVSKLARDSDTHEQIIEAGGLELLLGMILRLNEEAVWGLASMASVEDDWDAIEEVFDDEGVESVRDLLETAGDYGREGAAWAVCATCQTTPLAAGEARAREPAAPADRDGQERHAAMQESCRARAESHGHVTTTRRARRAASGA